jgi:predicted ATPase
MFFTVLSKDGRAPAGARDRAFLFRDNWDDWNKYQTMFYLKVADAEGVVHDVGSVKIGQVGLRSAPTVEPGQRAPEIPAEFDALDNRFFSLGQGEDYYVTLNGMVAALKDRVLKGLRDVAFNLDIFEACLGEDVMGNSLLRDIRQENVRSRLNRITRGDAALTKFNFRYTLPNAKDVPPAILDFVVRPESVPPTNVHVLIGRNGVGKSRCIRGLTEALLGREGNPDQPPGIIELIRAPLESGWSFAGLILISFSAFDNYDLDPVATDNMGSTQVGLRHKITVNGQDQFGMKSPAELAVDFRKSLSQCRNGLKADRWRDAVRTLETDDLFAEADVTALLDEARGADWNERTQKGFERLSSGHAIILLTVTRLVELVDEKTLVLLDEPEGHLHPPLLSAFIRCLSDLLVKRNGVAIIASHSPVVLQEVPRLCAWKLRRSRSVSVAERTTLETFGENVGLLTREVFGLEVTRAGFHQLLRKAVAEGRSFKDIVDYFDDQLGVEARAIVQALIAERDEP